MEKANAKLVWLMLFSLLTAAIGQAMIFTAAPASGTAHPVEAASIAAQVAHAVSSLLRTGTISI